jgi:hypothetical protein
MRLRARRWRRTCADVPPAVRNWRRGGRWGARCARCPHCPRPPRDLPEPAPEPRGVLRLALALCLPTALLLVAFRAPINAPSVDALQPSAVVQTLTRPFTAPAQTLWNRLQEVI